MKGPTRKDETPQKSLRHDYSKENVKGLPTTLDEARTSCKARKRKERQESISSLCQERKVIRSTSEERPRKHQEKNMRRVFSNEDFQKGDAKATGTERSQNDIILIYDDFEHERRRHHERFSKPLKMKNRAKSRTSHKPNNQTADVDDRDAQIELKFLQLHAADEKERSPSPVRNSGGSSSSSFAPDLDLSTLHEQVDCSEPLLSCASQIIDEDTETMPALSVASNHLLSSPRNSIIATHRIYLDPDVQQTPLTLNSKTQNPLELRLQKINKQINSLKKKIKKAEAEFETNHGYKVSHADKLNDKTLRKFYTDLNKMRKEQKQLIEVCPSDREMNQDSDGPRHLHDTLFEIEKRLHLQRDAAHRSINLEQLTNEELADEKLAVQKALLILESIHGRADNKEDRKLVRPIYDRYRILKRMISKIGSCSVSDQLATIHEDETMMNFVPVATPQLSEEKSPTLTSTDSSDTDTSLSENLHALSRFELVQQHRLVTEEKKELRRTIKTFEAEVQRKTGRMVQRDDKLTIEHVYVAYKKIKAKLKLLDALVGKQL